MTEDTEEDELNNISDAQLQNLPEEDMPSKPETINVDKEIKKATFQRVAFTLEKSVLPLIYFIGIHF